MWLPPPTYPGPMSGRNMARTALAEFPVCTLSVVQRVPRSAIAHVSVSPPLIPDGRLSRVRLAAAAYPQRTFPTIPKLKRSLVYTPSMIGYPSSSTPREVVTDTWLSVQTVLPV